MNVVAILVRARFLRKFGMYSRVCKFLQRGLCVFVGGGLTNVWLTDETFSVDFGKMFSVEVKCWQ